MTIKIKAVLFFAILFSWGCEKDKNNLPINDAPIPRILALSPENAGPGNLLTIRGVNFSNDPAKNIIRFNQTVVEAESVSETEIVVMVPEITTKTAAITVRANGKISNRKNLNLVQIKKFQDDFNRANVDAVDKDVTPNPLGEFWELQMGKLGLNNNRLAAFEGGIQAYMLYKNPEVDLKTGDGNFFKFSSEVTVSAGSFGGVIFNAQPDAKRFYLLRINGGMMQLLKTGNNGLDDWAAIMINQEFEGLAAGTNYRIDISSSNPGQFVIKITNVSTSGLVFERTVEDASPYTGGVAGYYYFSLANPTNIFFDNFLLEIQ